ncbi:MAG: CBS domain-containing protein, partial [Candidatus Angelobacter sp.]
METVRGDQKVSDFVVDIAGHECVPVVDEKERVIGIVYRRDLLGAAPDATALSIAHTDFPVAYTDEVVHGVAKRFLDGAYGHCLVLDSTSGELSGILTAFDILKTKNWELMQELQEPSRISGTSLLRFMTDRMPGK